LGTAGMAMAVRRENCTMKTILTFFYAFLITVCQAGALEFREVTFEGVRMSVVEVDLRKDQLELVLKDSEGLPLKTFARLEDHVEAQGRKLVFAMNAGMYEPDYSAVGLHVENGQEIHPLNNRPGEGNFYLKPNGVFLVGEKGARIVDAVKY